MADQEKYTEVFEQHAPLMSAEKHTDPLQRENSDPQCSSTQVTRPRQQIPDITCSVAPGGALPGKKLEMTSNELKIDPIFDCITKSSEYKDFKVQVL